MTIINFTTLKMVAIISSPPRTPSTMRKIVARSEPKIPNNLKIIDIFQLSSPDAASARPEDCNRIFPLSERRLTSGAFIPILNPSTSDLSCR